MRNVGGKIVLLPVTDTEAGRSSFAAGVGVQGRLFFCHHARYCIPQSRKANLCHDKNMKCYTSEFLTRLWYSISDICTCHVLLCMRFFRF